MPRGGFYAIHNSSIRFGRDGRWYADGEPIVNARIADLFARHIERAPGGGYRLRIADEQAPIVVDDTPFVVVAAGGGADGGVDIELNDRSRERLDPATLSVGADDVLYCRVKQGSESARFLRAAYYQLGPYIIATDGGGFGLRADGRVWPIGRG
jgi:uncharacterized protein